MNKEIKEQILQYLNTHTTAVHPFELSDELECPVDTVQTALNELYQSGLAAVTKKGRYARPQALGFLGARASALRSGAPLALPLDGSPALKIRHTNRLRALPDDILLVKVSGETCEIVDIPHRGLEALPAFLQIQAREVPHRRGKHGKKRFEPAEIVRTLVGIPCDRRIDYKILVDENGFHVRNDQIAQLAIDRYPEGDAPMTARVIRVFGSKSDMRARLNVIAAQHGFGEDFDDAVRKQCAAYPSGLTEADLKGREDLRSMSVFTIDGTFSKDFDDAVSLETLDDRARLGVHIADVSHFVRPNSAIDREAFRRGTSLYLPGLTVPMLPEALSNGLCSLMPDEDRLTLSLFMDIRDGVVIDHRLCAAVIRSRARLTYDDVNRLFADEENRVPEALHETLFAMRRLALSLRKHRHESGSIDLDLPEADFTLDAENNPVELFCAERGDAERLIEEFMLAANETVAALARNTETPLVYRVHEPPDADRLHTLAVFLQNLNLRFPLQNAEHPSVLQAVLEGTAEHPASDTVRRMLLRTMQRARYAAEPLGHYALAMRDYCHFTSPIRRYPDLEVHRMMKRLLLGEDTSARSEGMATIANQSSLREQESMLAEREADALMKAKYMSGRVGRLYNGVVSGVTAWGAYVTLPNTVEGLVHISTLDDYYEYDSDRQQLIAAGTRNVIRLGDPARVKVESVDLERSEIDFSLVPPRRR